MDYIIWLFCVLLILACVLAIVRSVFAWPMFAEFQPYATTAYFLIILLVLILFVQAVLGGPVALPLFPHHRL